VKNRSELRATVSTAKRPKAPKLSEGLFSPLSRDERSTIDSAMDEPVAALVITPPGFLHIGNTLAIGFELIGNDHCKPPHHYRDILLTARSKRTRMMIQHRTRASRNPRIPFGRTHRKTAPEPHRTRSADTFTALRMCCTVLGLCSLH